MSQNSNVPIKRQPFGGNNNIQSKSDWHETDPKEIEKYGIVIQTVYEEPTSAEGWERYLEKDFDKFKVFEASGAQEALKEMGTNRKDYQEKIAKLDEHEDIVKKRLKEDPMNTVYQTQLQNIYKLQAIGKILEKKGVVSDSYVSQVLSAPVDTSSSGPTENGAAAVETETSAPTQP